MAQARRTGRPRLNPFTRPRSLAPAPPNVYVLAMWTKPSDRAHRFGGTVAICALVAYAIGGWFAFEWLSPS